MDRLIEHVKETMNEEHVCSRTKTFLYGWVYIIETK